MFPSQFSSTLEEVLPSTGNRRRQETCTEGLTVVLLDGTWSDAKALDKRLDVLLSIHMRDFADGSAPLEANRERACFPFRSSVERESLLLGKRPAERSARPDQKRGSDGEGAAARADPPTATVDGQEGVSIAWRRVLPRVRLRNAGVLSAGPSLRKHGQHQCNSGTDAVAARWSEKEAVQTKERISTAGAFAMLLSELDCLANLPPKAPVKTLPAPALSNRCSDDHAFSKETQEGRNCSGWQTVRSAVLSLLDTQAEAFKRQMHGVK